MYDKSVAITGSTIEKTTKYDWFRAVSYTHLPRLR